MILSNQQIFSDGQAITATAISTNVIDLGQPQTPYDGRANLHQDVGNAMVPLLVQVTENFNNLTSLTIAIEKGSTTSLGTVVAQSTIVLADLVAGKQLPIINLPSDVDERYLGIRYTVAGTAPTAGRVTAGLVGGVQTNITGA